MTIEKHKTILSYFGKASEDDAVEEACVSSSLTRVSQDLGPAKHGKFPGRIMAK